MELKSISTMIRIIRSVIENPENEMYYEEDTGELRVILPRQKGTGSYNVIMYHCGTNMVIVRWYDTDIRGEIKFHLIPDLDDSDMGHSIGIDLDDHGSPGWYRMIEFYPVFTEEDYFQQSTLQDFGDVTLEDMISTDQFMKYVDELLRNREKY